MSLINDALKRASSPGSSIAAPQQIPGAVAHAVEAVSYPGTGKLLLGIGGALVLILCAGTFFFVQSEKALAKSPTVHPVAQGQPAPAQTSTAAEILSQPLQAAPALAVVAQHAVVEAEPVAQQIQPAAVVPPAEAVVAKPQKENLRVQAIYYRLKDPTAVINGTTVREGDLLAGATVASINRHSVDLDFAGRKQVVRLE